MSCRGDVLMHMHFAAVNGESRKTWELEMQAVADLRELNAPEIEAVAGGVWPLIGAAGGGMMAYSEANRDGYVSGNEWIGITGAALTGAVGGAAVGGIRRVVVTLVRKK